MPQHTITPLFPEHGWEESNNLLDTFFYQELTKAEYRRSHENESIKQSAQIIHENMLNRILKIQTQTNTCSTKNLTPELTLNDNICKTLNLPAQSITSRLNEAYLLKDSV